MPPGLSSPYAGEWPNCSASAAAACRLIWESGRIVAGCILLGAAGVMKYVERGTKMFEKDLRKRVGLFVMWRQSCCFLPAVASRKPCPLVGRTGLAKLSEMLAKPHSEEAWKGPNV